jgi:hypothetical protein
MGQIEASLAAMGFAPPTTNVVPQWKSGIYVLHLARGRYYVGQSIDLAGRLATHRRTFPDIEQVSLFRVTGGKAALGEREVETIRTLERQGFSLLNIVHASITYQSSPFDDLVSPEQQQQWLADPTTLHVGTRPTIAQDIRLKQAAKLPRLKQRLDAERLITCLRQYVAACIPAPASTEPIYWGVSCMPSTNVSTWPWIACLNSNTMEIFVTGYLKENPNEIWAFLNVSAVALWEAYSSSARLKAAHRGVTLKKVGYTAAGHDQVNIHVTGIAQLEQLLSDPGIFAAARLFNLHLMRKRNNFFARFHCYDLADHLIPSTGDSAV